MAKSGRRFVAVLSLFILTCLHVSVTEHFVHDEKHGESVNVPDSELEEIFAPEEKEYGEHIYTCGKPEAPENGYIRGTDYSMGEKVFVVCNHGYHLEGSSPMTCLAVPDPFNKRVIWDPQGERKCIANSFADEQLEEEQKEQWNPEENPNINVDEFPDGEDIENDEPIEKEMLPEIEEEDLSNGLTMPSMLDELSPDLKDQHAVHPKTNTAVPEKCALPSESGPCKAYFERYFFNSSSGKCEMFIYGGCNGNENNFETVEKCEADCHK